jgi:hypothetical protein
MNLKNAILKCLPVLQPLIKRYTAPHQVWGKRGEGLWHAEVVLRPDLSQVFMAADKQLNEAAQPFAESFLAHHPEYNGIVSFRRYVFVNFGRNITIIFRHAISHLWRQHESFELDASAVEWFVNEFEAFVDNPTVRFLFRCNLLNFNTSADSIDLPEGLRIRRMTPSEVTALYGGSMEALGSLRPRGLGLHEFCIEGETEEPKTFGDLKEEQPEKDHVKALLDRAILCLRTFKEGCVGYDYVHLYPRTFCPLSLPIYTYGDINVPFSRYTLSVEENGLLTQHASIVFANSEPSMEMACSRLADAENRIKPQDRLIDAVIGMESLLLAGLSSEDRKGELKFRFSLHYSTLFGTPEERHRAFRVAKHLYDLRSKVAHGSTLGDAMHSVGDEKLTLPEAAKRASETLRFLVKYFLPSVKQAPYRKHEFWERAYFGRSDAQPAEPSAAADPPRIRATGGS